MKTKLIIAIAMAAPTLAAAESSPWLPIPSSAQVSLGYVNSSGDKFDAGTTRMTLPAKIKQGTTSVGLKLGLTDEFAIDTSLNYVDSKFADASQKQGKMSDTTFGARLRVVDEFEHAMAPTVTLRANAIIRGSYETGRPDAIGDGGTGFELSVLAGKYLMPTLAINGELGYRNRDNMIPSDIWVDMNAGYSPMSRLSVSAGATITRSQGDLDIAGPGFTGARFPEVKEDRNLVKLGASYAIMSNLAVNLNVGKVVSGRNATLATLWGASVVSSF